MNDSPRGHLANQSRAAQDLGRGGEGCCVTVTATPLVEGEKTLHRSPFLAFSVSLCFVLDAHFVYVRPSCARHVGHLLVVFFSLTSCVVRVG